MDWDVKTSAPEDMSLPPAMDEVWRYWDDKRQLNFAPRWSDFKLYELSAAAIPRMIVVDVEQDPLDFRYRFWGTEQTQRIGYDATGLAVRENKLFGHKVYDEWKMVFDERRPIVFSTSVARSDGLIRAYQRIRLPLSEDGETISNLVSLAEHPPDLLEVFGEAKNH